MNIGDRLHQLANRIPSQIDFIQTEEATKNAFVMPFISALGFDVFNPQEVTPELVADVGTKKGEKVDYAILKDGQPIILIECKHCGVDLDHAHVSQLFRYFATTPARIGIVTNGVVYRFFSDLEAANKMDDKPFLEVNLLDLTEPGIEAVKKFSKESFDLEQVLADASSLKYTKAIKGLLATELKDPSEDFIRYLTNQVYSGRITQNVKEEFAPIVRKALKEYIRERVADRLRSALQTEQDSPDESPAPDNEVEAHEDDDNGIVTTEEEVQAYYIIKAIASKTVASSRIAMRDAKSYCAILLDDNNRKTICRLRFNTTQKYIGILNAEKTETRIAIEKLEDIYSSSDQILQIISSYEESA
ncbi:MAG: type I restriction endonuclease [Acidobacteriota bacterium]